jgi:hypothetical protein
MADENVLRPSGRGLPLVATWARWSVATAALSVVLILAAETYLALAHSRRTLSSLSPPIAVACVVLAGLLWATLRAEELRLARELRIARAGTSVLRAMVARPRQGVPSLMRLLSTKLGTAAVLLADGERSDAVDVLARGSPLMHGGRLERLRRIVDADLERATGTSGGLDVCVRELRSMSRIGSREADLYRTHVLVKALLEQGDADGAREVARELDASRDDEERVYLVWLRTWFDLDVEAPEGDRPWPSLSQGELRMAALLARAHGADKLVEKLQSRLAAIARPVEGE